MTGRLDGWIKDIEARLPAFQGWATPGASSLSAALHLARTICRRAERRVCALQVSGQLPNPEMTIYLNRLSDLLWLLAQAAEKERA
jgi:cob(I)alamin adenosyltransferase